MEKSELIEIMQDERQEIEEMLEDLPDEDLLEPGVMGDWTIKDILNHLSFWEGQIVTLLYQAQRGLPTPTTAHFSKDSMDTLNQRWYEEGKNRPLEIVWKDWLGVRKQAIRRVSELSETDLNDPQRFDWLKGVPLFQWVLSDTVEHEGEHADQIREWLEARDSSSGDDAVAGSNGKGSME